jgi:hypothetical protein
MVHVMRTLSRYLKAISLLGFLVYIALSTLTLAKYAKHADVKANNTVSTSGDAHGYQKMAVNILRGLGPADSESLPLSEYKLDLSTPWGEAALAYEHQNGPRPVNSHFDRPPGFPLMLAATYSITGVDSLYARYLIAICVSLGALFLALGGYCVSPTLGALAGMLTAFIYLSAAQPAWFDGILTEIPASFWVAAFFSFFALYERLDDQRSQHLKTTAMAISAFSLTMAIFTRFNFFTVIPFMLAYLVWRRASRFRVILFLLITCIPLALWSSYASSKLGKFTFLSTQGSGLFSTSNNIDSLNGLGADGWNRGGWNPGWIKGQDGSLSCDYRYLPPDGSGWKRGLSFWRQNLTELPRLFYNKAEKGLWYNDGIVTLPTKPEGFHILAICFLLLAIGQRHLSRERSNPSHALGWVNLTQVALITAAVYCWNTVPFYWILTIWIGLLILSLLRAIRGTPRLGLPMPLWAASFVLSHVISTLVFYGSWRFHQPFDLLMFFLAFFGLMATIKSVYEKNGPMGILTGITWAALIARQFQLV